MQGKNRFGSFVEPLMNALPFFAVRRAVQEAHDWTLRLDQPTQADNDAFMDWLAASPRNVKAYLELTAFTEELARKAESGELAAAFAVPEPATMREHLIRAWPRYAVAATAIGLAVGAVQFVKDTSAPSAPAVVAVVQPYGHVFVSEKNKSKSFPLPDGSRLDLNRDSRARVFFDQHGRRVDLIAGELKATVSHDANRPFSVFAAGARVTATGTDFSVRLLGPGLTDIGVNEGAVKVERLVTVGPSPAGFESVKAGQVAMSGPSGLVRRDIDAKKLKQRMAFQAASRLEFNDASLDEVIKIFNSFNAVQLRIAAGAGNLDVRLIGTFDFDASDLPGLIQALSFMHIRATGPDRDGVIELSRQE